MAPGTFGLRPRPRLRALKQEEIRDVARFLAAAFVDDQGWAYILPDNCPRQTLLEDIHDSILRLDRGVGARITVAEDTESGLPEGVSIWYPPLTSEPPLWRWIGQAPRLGGMLRRPRAILRSHRLQKAIGEPRPQDASHGYLRILAVAPSAQGKGIGSALLQDCFAHCRLEGVSAYLETFKKENVEYYRSQGFRLIKEVELPKFPPFWTMVRH